MKHLYRTLPMKIICFILCIATLTISVASIFGAIFFIDVGVYTNSEEEIFDDFSYGSLHGDSYNIVNYALNPNGYTNSYRFPFTKESSNLRFMLVSPDGETISKNLDDPPSENSSAWKYTFLFDVTYEDGDIYIYGIDRITGQENVYTLFAYLEEELPIDDEYALISRFVHIIYSLRYSVYIIGIISAVVFIICFITLMCASGRRPDSDRLHAGPLYKVPFDLLAALIASLFLFCFYLADSVFYTGELAVVITAILISFFAVIAFFGLCISLAARIKGQTLFKNTLVWMMCKLFWKTLKWTARIIRALAKALAELFYSIPLIWRTVLIVIFSAFIDFLLIIAAFKDSDLAIFFWLIKNTVFALTALYAALFMRRLQKGGNALAKGDLSYKVDTKMMFWDFRRHGENLNSISSGMAKAVEERLSSERMKTELITNVSHDIKTPLTSIINYADLISKETCNCEKHGKYSEVLIRKSEHLKRLLDDLVEISKASTGNLEVSLLPCEASVLLTQAAGEFEEKCRVSGLELITGQTEKSVKIMADSRRIWRVFENLMSNACKYSLPGSRVYLSLEEADGEARFIFRNTSRSALNVSPSELTERFVRGDTSRSTEGNGLGLSIAKSLTELQGGKMDITIDGDLFKVTLSFPVI